MINFWTSDFLRSRLLWFYLVFLKFVKHQLSIQSEWQSGKIILLEISLWVTDNPILDFFKFHPDLRRGFTFEFLVLIVIFCRKKQIELKINIVSVKIWKSFKLHSKLYKIVKGNSLIYIKQNPYQSTWWQRLWSERTCLRRRNHCEFSFSGVCSCVDVGIRREWQRSWVNEDVLLDCFTLCKWRLKLMRGLDWASRRFWNRGVREWIRRQPWNSCLIV